MNRSLRHLLALFIVAPLVFAAGCAQGQGERCQVQSDCATGLQCVLPAGGTPQAGGTCQPMGGGDAGVPVDMVGGDLTVRGD